MPLFAVTWPWIGLGAGGVLILMLACGDLLQDDRRATRWEDITWLTWAGLAAYLLHQFEEHGIDLFGRPYAFRGALCAVVGYRDAIACPIPLSFITAVNVGGVWGAGLIAALASRRWPLIGLSFFAVPLVNIAAHVGPAVVERRYNPGLATAVLVFLPLCLWTVRVAMARYGARGSALAALVCAGVAVHAVLLASLFAFLKGVMVESVLAAVQLATGVIPAAVMYLGVMGGQARSGQARSGQVRGRQDASAQPGDAFKAKPAKGRADPARPRKPRAPRKPRPAEAPPPEQA